MIEGEGASKKKASLAAHHSAAVSEERSPEGESKKVSNIENEKRRGKEREARKVPLLPFLIHSFHAAAVSRTTLKFSRLSHVRGGEKTKKKLNKSHPLSSTDDRKLLRIKV